jgi:prolipoprotein diacylglyceryl transferase
MIWNVDPILFSIGPISVRWYGLLFMIGFMVGYKLMRDIFTRDGLSTDSLDSFLMYLIVGTTVGARLGHCLFYAPGYYFAHPLEIPKIWEGGLASHGGFIGVFVATWLFSRRYKLPLLYLLDRVAIFGLFTGSLIRIGNLMNSEIVGRPTNVPWAFVFAHVDQVPRHPTQIYESAAYFLISFTAWRLEQKKHSTLPNGMILGFILAAGFAARFGLEFFKENQEAFEQGMVLNMGQLLSLLPILLGLVLMLMLKGRAVPAKVKA